METSSNPCAFCKDAIESGSKSSACAKCLKTLKATRYQKLEPGIDKLCGVCRKNQVKGKTGGCAECLKAMLPKSYKKQHDSLDAAITDILYGRMPIKAAIERLVG